MKKNPDLHVYYAANEWGYIVQLVCGVRVLKSFSAGNRIRDLHEEVCSEPVTTIIPLTKAEPPALLRKYAEMIARIMANDNRVYKKNIQYDSDLHQQIPMGP